MSVWRSEVGPVYPGRFGLTSSIAKPARAGFAIRKFTTNGSRGLVLRAVKALVMITSSDSFRIRPPSESL